MKVHTVLALCAIAACTHLVHAGNLRGLQGDPSAPAADSAVAENAMVSANSTDDAGASSTGVSAAATDTAPPSGSDGVGASSSTGTETASSPTASSDTATPSTDSVAAPAAPPGADGNSTGKPTLWSATTWVVLFETKKSGTESPKIGFLVARSALSPNRTLSSFSFALKYLEASTAPGTAGMEAGETPPTGGAGGDVLTAGTETDGSGVMTATGGGIGQPIEIGPGGVPLVGGKRPLVCTSRFRISVPYRTFTLLRSCDHCCGRELKVCQFRPRGALGRVALDSTSFQWSHTRSHRRESSCFLRPTRAWISRAA